MSDFTPPDAPEDTAMLSEPEPPAAPSSKGRRTAIIAAVSVAVVAVLGGGAYAAFMLMASGPQPAEALPASTLGLVSVDLDPSAKQKIAAIKTLHKFPGLKKDINLGSRDDLREYIFKQATQSGTCKSLDYADDIKPWLGDRAAVAAVGMGAKKVAPAIVLLVSDEDKARVGVQKIIKCGHPGDDFGYAFNDKYLIISDSTDHAKQIVADAKRSTLSDDASYQKWTDAAGDAGEVNFYVSAKAADYVADALSGLSKEFASGLTGGPEGGLPGGLPTDFPSGFPTDLPSGFPSDLPNGFPTDLPTDFPDGSGAGASAPRAADPTDPITDALKKFKGLAGTVRFADGGMELEIVTGGLQSGSPSGSASSAVEKLPSDTAVVLGVGPAKDPKALGKAFLDGASGQLGGDPRKLDDAGALFGLNLPDDLVTLLGKGVTASLGADAPADLEATKGPADLPFGLTVNGDADKIKAVLTKVESSSGGRNLLGDALNVDSKGDKVAVATNPDYLKDLLAGGSLGDSSTFKGVVPDAGKASSIFYVDFDSKWRDAIVKSIGSDDSGSADDVARNLKPLKAFGVSSWVDGGTSHVKLKVTTN